MIDQQYNQHNLEALFKDFLVSGIKENNTVKNYLSDLRHFLGWLHQRVKNDFLINAITKDNLELYKTDLIASHIPATTINRRLSTIRSFCAFCQRHLGLLTDNPAKNLTNVPLTAQKKNLSVKQSPTKNYQLLPKELINKEDPSSIKSINRLTSLRINIHRSFWIAGSMIVLISLFVFGLWYFFQNLNMGANDIVGPAKKSDRQRNILFQGRLTDSLGNPLQSKTDVRFSLYDDPQAGRRLYTTGVCSLTPDEDGLFSVEVGDQCGQKIASDLFLNTPRVYLGVTVGQDGEMRPREPIGNVEYAEDSKRLAGYPVGPSDGVNPEASQGAEINSIPLINQFGNLVIAAENPKIWSTSGNFQLRGQAITLATEPGSAGDIVFSPDAGGRSLFPNGSVGVGTDGDLSFKLQTAGPIGPDKDGAYDLGSASLRWDKLYANQVIGGETGIQGYLQRTGGSLSSTNKTDGLLLGDAATASATVKLAGSASENSFIKAGNFGVGTRTAQEELTIGDAGTLAMEMGPPKNVTVKAGSSGTLAAGTYYFKIVAGDGVGWTVGSSEVACTTNGSSLNRCGLSWDTVTGASSYRVYKGTASGAQDRYQTVSTTSYNYDGDGGATSGAVPSSTTAYVNKLSPSGSSWLLAGHLGLGETNPSKAKLQIDAGGRLIYLNNTGTSNSVEDDNGAKLTAAGVWTDASDATKKKNVSDLNYGLTEVLKLRPVSYRWIENGLTDIGFIAQEVQKVIPEVVFGHEGNLSLSYGHLTSLIVKSIQEQEKNLAGLSEKIGHLYETVHNLFVQNLTVKQKIVSPVVETTKLEVSGSANINELKTDKITAGEFLPKDNDLVFNGIANLIVKNLDGAAVAVVDAEGNASFSGALRSQALETETATISGLLAAEEINADQITASSSSFIDSNIHNLTSSTISATEASFSSTLRAKTVEAENINEIQRLLAEVRNQPLPDARYYQNLSDQTYLTDSNRLQLVRTDSDPFQPIATDFKSLQSTLTDLTVSGLTNLYRASIADSITIGNLLFKDEGLLSLSWELKLSALSTINLLDGAVVVAKDGNLTTRGQLIAQGGVRTNQIRPVDDGEVVTISSPYFENGISLGKTTSATSSAAIIAAADNFAKNGLYAPALEAETKTAGVGLLPAYTNEIVIYTDQLTDQSLIYLTPTSPTQNKTLFVAQKQTCLAKENELADETPTCKPYFKVALDKAINAEIKFNWWIVN